MEVPFCMQTCSRRCHILPICMSPQVIVIGSEGSALSKAQLASLLLGAMVKCIPLPSLMQKLPCLWVGTSPSLPRLGNESGRAVNMILRIKLFPGKFHDSIIQLQGAWLPAGGVGIKMIPVKARITVMEWLWPQGLGENYTPSLISM